MSMMWGALMLVVVPILFSEIKYVNAGNEHVEILKFLLIMNAIFICYFWLNGTKDIVYVLWFYLNKNKILHSQDFVQNYKVSQNKRVVMLYCTCNDFEPEPLRKCLKQSYPNVKTIILDDSSKSEYIDMVDKFAIDYNLEVVRRSDRVGFKAGKLNHYLKNKVDYDYFVILDSDEIIPYDYVEKSLKYFEAYSNIGILQANHISTRNTNKFMELFHIGVNSHWITYQSTKNMYGFMSLLGHGAMVSRECYEAAGGFPNVVAEDLCLSIERRSAGYYTGFAPEIICEEEYPVDYIAFKKRHNKWTQGNLEFIKRYTKRIISSNMKWFEKADIFLFTYNLPLTAFFSFYVIINILLLPLFKYKLHYPSWMLIPTAIFFIAPMINDMVTYFKKIRIYSLFKYMFLVFVLYGSMLYVSMKSSFLGLIGKKAIFIVTPKDQNQITLIQAIRAQKEELTFARIMAFISLKFDYSILPVALIVFPAIISVFLCMYSNTKEKKQVL